MVGIMEEACGRDHGRSVWWGSWKKRVVVIMEEACGN